MTHPTTIIIILAAFLIMPATHAEDWIQQTTQTLLKKISQEAEQLQKLNETIHQLKLKADRQLQDQRLERTEQQRQLTRRQTQLTRQRQKLKDETFLNQEIHTATQNVKLLTDNDLDQWLEELNSNTKQALQIIHNDIQATTPDGTIVTGTKAQAGPFAFFQGNPPHPMTGILHQTSQQPYPQLFTLLAPEDQNQLHLLFQGQLATPPLDPSGGKALAVMKQSPSCWQHLRKGGLIMVPLGLIALITTVTVLFKACQFASFNAPLKRLETCAHTHPELDADQLEEQLFLIAGQNLAPRERFLSTIAVCASASPLLGLLGTVTGMIHTFSLITVYGTGDPRLLSAGISEALITTEVGLAIAIPAILAHVWLTRKLKRFKQRQQQLAIQLVSQRNLPPKP